MMGGYSDLDVDVAIDDADDLSLEWNFDFSDVVVDG